MEDTMNTYTKKERNMYLIGLMGQNVIYNVIATGMTFYFQSVIFIPAIASQIRATPIITLIAIAGMKITLWK